MSLDLIICQGRFEGNTKSINLSMKALFCGFVSSRRIVFIRECVRVVRHRELVCSEVDSFSINAIVEMVSTSMPACGAENFSSINFPYDYCGLRALSI